MFPSQTVHHSHDRFCSLGFLTVIFFDASKTQPAFRPLTYKSSSHTALCPTLTDPWPEHAQYLPRFLVSALRGLASTFINRPGDRTISTRNDSVTSHTHRQQKPQSHSHAHPPIHAAISSTPTNHPYHPQQPQHQPTPPPLQPR